MFVKGQKVAKVISGMGIKTVTFDNTIAYEKDDTWAVVADSTGDVCDDEDLASYDLQNGQAKENVIPGFMSYIESREVAARKVRDGEYNLDDGEEIPEGL